MKKKQVVVMTMAAVMACGAMTACGGSKSDAGNNAAAGSEASGETGSAEGKQVLSVTTWDNESTPQFQAVIDAYEEKNPDVEIKIIDTSADEYNNSLGISLSAAQPDPDVIWVKDMGSMLQMADKEQLLPIDEFIKKDNLDLSIYKGAAEQLQYNGVSYALPYRNDWYVLYYNKDLFDAAGVEYPSNDMTWQEYYDLAAKLTSGEGSSKVYGSHNHTWQALVTNWAVQDGEHTVVEKDYSFMKPAYEQAVRMQDEGIMQSYANLKTGSIHYISVFEQQQCAMLPMGSWFIGTLIQDKEAGKFDFNWGVTTIPHPEGVEAGATVGSTTPVAINAKSDDPDLAWEFVKFATGEEGAMALADNGIFPAASTDAINEKLAAIPGFPEDGTDALNITSWVLDRPIDAKMAAVRKVLEEEHDLIMIGEEDIDTGIANMNQRAKEARED